jgi:hypothetical protein
MPVNMHIYHGADVLDFSFRDCPIELANMGTGPALDVCGVLMDAMPSTTSVRRRFSYWTRVPIDAGKQSRNTFNGGGSIVDGKGVLGTEPLWPPAKPSDYEILHGLAEVYVARLSLSYKDIFGPTHSTTIDYAQSARWINPHLQVNLLAGLSEIEAAAQGDSHN